MLRFHLQGGGCICPPSVGPSPDSTTYCQQHTRSLAACTTCRRDRQTDNATGHASAFHNCFTKERAWAQHTLLFMHMMCTGTGSTGYCVKSTSTTGGTNAAASTAHAGSQAAQTSPSTSVLTWASCLGKATQHNPPCVLLLVLLLGACLHQGAEFPAA
jgi:hypothetical protein